MPSYNTQTTYSTGGTTGVNKTYYDKNMLEVAKTQFVYAQYGQKRPLPKNKGKKVEMRRWSLWDPTLAMTPLTEGETPDGLSLEQDLVEAEVKQYGAYFTYSDMLNLTAFDEVLNAGSERLGEMLGTVVEWVTRDELATGNNVNWAGSATSRAALTSADTLTSADIRKAVRDLKKRKARMFNRNGRKHYIAIVSPDAVYDLQGDEMWQAANMYVEQEALYSGELGRLFGMVFVESTEAPIFQNALTDVLAPNGYNAGAKTVAVAGDIPDAAAAYLESAGAQILVGGERANIAQFDRASGVITLAEALAATPAAEAPVLSCDGADSGIPIHQTICFGQDAYGTIDIGSGSIESIIKGVGEGGFDPLNQRGTVGGKVMAYAAKILNEDWILRVEHAASN